MGWRATVSADIARTWPVGQMVTDESFRNRRLGIPPRNTLACAAVAGVMTSMSDRLPGRK
jgi:hypothetical protein